jgi:hypothetical protein
MHPRRAFSAALLLATALAAPPAAGQAADAQTRSAARKLGADALKLYDAGDYAGALEKFNLADQLVPAPTLGLRAARCLAKLGRLVEASERYLDVTRMQLDRSAPLVHRKAQADALAERDKLLPTIPSLEIIIEGPLGDGVSVLIDGKPVPPQLLGQRQPADPGPHKVTAKRADTTVEQDVTLSLGGSGSVKLTFPPLPAAPAPGADTGAAGNGNSPRRTIGIVAVAAGGAFVAFGGVMGALAISTQQSLLQKCGPSRNCPPSAWGQANAYDVMRASTTIGLVAGGVGLAVGIPLILTAPGKPDAGKPDQRPKAEVTPFIGLGSAGVRGRF